MRDLWSGTYKKPAFWEEFAKHLVELAKLLPGACILDVGTGYGGTLFPAAHLIGTTGRIVGIDVEKECVEWTREQASKLDHSDVEILLMDARSMSFPNEAFEVVIAGMLGLDEDYDFDTGEILDGAPIIREILRVLRPGGLFCHSSWLWQEDNEWMRELVWRYLPDCRKRGYWPGTEEGYVDLLERFGFEDIRVTTAEREYSFDDAADWMAVVNHMWEPELERIRSLPAERLKAFEKDALELLAAHVDEGKLVYSRSALFVLAHKPASS